VAGISNPWLVFLQVAVAIFRFLYIPSLATRVASARLFGEALADRRRIPQKHRRPIVARAPKRLTAWKKTRLLKALPPNRPAFRGQKTRFLPGAPSPRVETALDWLLKAPKALSAI
jgi:hypothetical protein